MKKKNQRRNVPEHTQEIKVINYFELPTFQVIEKSVQDKNGEG